MASDGSPSRVRLPRNVRLFIWFRLLFNSRFYYPVYAILFLDFGLTASQFMVLNAVWAVTIVLLEIPSGALADLVGRRRLLVAAGGTMMLEMAVFLFCPANAGGLTFAVLLLNRVLSGAAEAIAQTWRWSRRRLSRWRYTGKPCFGGHWDFCSPLLSLSGAVIEQLSVQRVAIPRQ